MTQAEEKLQTCQQEAKQQLPPPPHVGRAYLEAAAAVLEELAVKLAWRAHFCQLVAAARGMTLHPQSTSPRTIKVRIPGACRAQTWCCHANVSLLAAPINACLWCLQAFLETHPQTARINERATVLLDFPEFPCPCSPGANDHVSSMTASPGAQAALEAGSAAQGPQCRFHLLAQPSLSSSGGARWQHILLMSSCDHLGAPAQVVCSTLHL